MNENLEKIFKTNPFISHITENIYCELKDIPIETLQSENEYYQKYLQKFFIIKSNKKLKEQKI